MISKIQLEKKLNDINTVLTNSHISIDDIGVLSGISGIALFHFYYFKYAKKEESHEIGIEVLNEIVNRINQGYTNPTFCSGIAGAGWVFDHLSEEKLITIETDNLLKDLDNFLYKKMISDLKLNHFDFLHAAIGYGYYFLNRYKNSKKDSLKDRYEKYLKSLIIQLKKASINDQHGIKWNSNYGSKNGFLECNLGLAHGMSSIIIFFSKLYEFKKFKKSVHSILKNAIKFLEMQEITINKSHSCFPNSIGNSLKNNVDSRLAWCNGDLGIGIALLKASQALNDNRLQIKAIRVLEGSTKRKLYKETRVKDAGICHGSYGNALIYNRIHKITNSIVFKESRDYWLKTGLDMDFHKDGLVGYKQWNPKEHKWEKEKSLLEGIAGIGLVIIEILANFETKWDECLMIQ